MESIVSEVTFIKICFFPRKHPAHSTKEGSALKKSHSKKAQDGGVPYSECYKCSDWLINCHVIPLGPFDWLGGIPVGAVPSTDAGCDLSVLESQWSNTLLPFTLKSSIISY